MSKRTKIIAINIVIIFVAFFSSKSLVEFLLESIIITLLMAIISAQNAKVETDAIKRVVLAKSTLETQNSKKNRKTNLPVKAIILYIKDIIVVTLILILIIVILTKLNIFVFTDKS